jgi:hypothetical protein
MQIVSLLDGRGYERMYNEDVPSFEEEAAKN